MSQIVDYPFREPFIPDSFEFGSSSATIAVKSTLNGGIQTSETPGKRWRIGMVLPLAVSQWRAEVEGFYDSLNGQAVRVRLWHMGRVGLQGRGTPQGTINLNGVTVKANAAQFAASVTLTNCGAMKTFEAGDMFKINNQLFMNPVRVSADINGDMTVPTTGLLRDALTAGMPVTLNRPTALFVLTSGDWRATHHPGQYSSDFAADFEEVFA